MSFLNILQYFVNRLLDWCYGTFSLRGNAVIYAPIDCPDDIATAAEAGSNFMANIFKKVSC
jgi:hypothetical protein